MKTPEALKIAVSLIVCHIESVGHFETHTIWN